MFLVGHLSLVARGMSMNVSKLEERYNDKNAQERRTNNKKKMC
jgi:hypothetical protein